MFTDVTYDVYARLLQLGVGPHFVGRIQDVRDWSLITGRGGATKREGGHVKFYPYEKVGRKRF